jgi:hypothetical protein
MQLSQQQCHENNLVTASLLMIYFVYKNLATGHSTLAAASTAAVVCTSSCEEQIEMARGLRPATSSSCTAPACCFHSHILPHSCKGAKACMQGSGAFAAFLLLLLSQLHPVDQLFIQ